MRQIFYLIAVLVALTWLGACGGQDRSALATKTVRTYWYDIGHGKIKQAYHLMTSGNQADRTANAYQQDMYSFLEHMGGISATTGKPDVNGDKAVVPVKLSSPGNPAHLDAYQHLFWENDGWRIADQNGGLSHKK